MSDTVEYLLNCLDNIKSNVNSQRITIYVGIGSASHMKVEDPQTHEWSIEPKYDQQYPVFLKSLKNLCPKDPVHIFLIDPFLEEVPFMICDRYNKLSNDFAFDYNSKSYHNDKTNITVYPIRKSVSYPNDGRQNNDEQHVDLTLFFDVLNILAIEEQWLVFGQDYSGRNIANMKRHYSSVLSNHHDHIIYGIADGLDGGCYIDLTLPICNFEYIVYERYVRIFGLSNFENLHEFLEAKQQFHETTGKHNSPILNNQIKQYVESKKKFILQDVIGLMRQLQANNLGRNIDVSREYITSIADNYDFELPQLIDKDPVRAFVTLKTLVLPRELELLLYHKYKSFTESKIDEIMSCVFSENDPYKWNDILRNIWKNEKLY